MPSGQIRWLKDIVPIDHMPIAESARSIEVISSPSGSLCLLCKGGRMLCGKLSCPVITRAQSLAKLGAVIDSDHISGSTPPGVFVGRIGYPKVYIGPMIPPIHGDTTILDTPELWLGKSIEQIVDYRYSLVRGKSRSNVYAAVDGGRLLGTLQELAMGSTPADAEATFTKKPRRVLALSEDTQPFGPSAPLKSFKTSHFSVDKRIEDAFYDHDLRAADAALALYDDGVLVTRIQRAFSIGMFGLKARRKLVPTRWSITAVDSNISLRLVNQIKQYPTIDKYRVHAFNYLDNIYVAILMPENWRFEWIEAWFPGTAWNPEQPGSGAVLMGDAESYHGRTTYASIGGCYYSARLAIAEKLRKEQRQASALVLREIHPGYILPVGVWNVRESVRATLECQANECDSFQSAMQLAIKHLTIPLRKWIEGSVLLKEALFQRKITDYRQSVAHS